MKICLPSGRSNETYVADDRPSIVTVSSERSESTNIECVDAYISNDDTTISDAPTLFYNKLFFIWYCFISKLLSPNRNQNQIGFILNSLPVQMIPEFPLVKRKTCGRLVFLKRTLYCQRGCFLLTIYWFGLKNIIQISTFYLVGHVFLSIVCSSLNRLTSKIMYIKVTGVGNFIIV